MWQMFIVYSLLILKTLTEASAIKYIQEPSTMDRHCNPYHQSIKLTCTIEREPTTLNLPLPHIHWYWSSDPDHCLLLHQDYRCSQYLGYSKYTFEFQHYRSNESEEGEDQISYYTWDLTIRNVSSIDIGCYYCQTVMGTVGENKTSGSFCIESESNYIQFELCNDSTPSPVPPNKQRESNGGNSNAAVILLCVLCLILGISTTSLAIISVVLGYRYITRKRAAPQCEGQYQSSCEGNGDSSFITPYSAMDQPNYVGTYSLVRPHRHISGSFSSISIHNMQPHFQEDNTQQTSETSEVQSNLSDSNSAGRLSDGNIDGLESGNTGRLVSGNTGRLASGNTGRLASGNTGRLASGNTGRLASGNTHRPGSSIYKTLDKYLEDIEYFMAEGDSNEIYDRLFDDPNYSPISPSNVSSVFSPVENKRYDKLESKLSTEGDYAYAYSHLVEKRKKSKLQASQQDILSIAALGTYEMDPEFLSLIRTGYPERENSMPLLTSVAGQDLQANGYQSLDCSKLTPENSYSSLNMNNNIQ